MIFENDLLTNIGKLHTTELGAARIKRNLALDTDNVAEWCRAKIMSENAVITRSGKNWYVEADNCVITVNAYSYTIITVHRQRGRGVDKTAGRELMEQLEAYQPYNEQEEKDKALMLHCLKTEKHIFTRQNTLAHMTASAWVVNKGRDKVLMAYHNIYDSWSWLGGHADGEENLLQAAIKEVREESGICDVRAVSEEIFSLEALTVDGHIKNGSYVSSHLHLNVTYLLEADDGQVVAVKPDENSGVAWFGLEGAVAASSEPWFREHIYKKLNEKLRSYLL